MASEVADEERPDATTLLKDDRVMNAVMRLITAVSGVGCLGFAAFQAVHAPDAVVTGGFLLTGLVLIVLALASDPKVTPSS